MEAGALRSPPAPFAPHLARGSLRPMATVGVGQSALHRPSPSYFTISHKKVDLHGIPWRSVNLMIALHFIQYFYFGEFNKSYNRRLQMTSCALFIYEFIVNKCYHIPGHVCTFQGKPGRKCSLAVDSMSMETYYEMEGTTNTVGGRPRAPRKELLWSNPQR